MTKIYSRPRIKIPKLFIQFNLKNVNGNNNKNIKRKRKLKKLLKFLIIMLIAFSTFKFVLDAILPIFNGKCESKAKSIAAIISNKKSMEIMEQHTYDELFTIEKDDNGKIIMMKSNANTINKIMAEVAIKIQDEINNKEKDSIKIPLGSFTGIKFLSSFGPNMKITISTSGNVETNLKSEFISQGINQTLHRVYLEVKCKINILTPFEKISTEATNQILLAEVVIIGNIPETYYNFKGTGDEASNLIN